jgi:hypothetical protein
VSLVPAYVADPPLDPSGDEARSLLGRELLHPEYHDRNLVEQLLDWLDRLLGGTIDAAADAPPLSTFLAIAAFLVLGLAERALAEGRSAVAVVEGFRALTLRQVQRGWLEDQPGATAREVALALGDTHPELRAPVEESARLFDAVLYGGRAATHEQAVEVLALDDALAGAQR